MISQRDEAVTLGSCFERVAHSAAQAPSYALLSFAVCALLSLAAAAEGAAPRAPNIVFVLVDDLGHGDLGAYGGTAIATPRIDRLAAEGMLFQQYYSNSPVCSPSRAAILTGRHPTHFGLRFGYRPRSLPTEFPTLAEYLRDEGYVTAHFGKWNLGPGGDLDRPSARGFGYSVVLSERVDSKYVGGTFAIVDRLGDQMIEREEQPPGHLTANTMRYAIEFIERVNTQPNARPFFANIWLHAAHSPYLAPSPAEVEPEYAETYPAYDLGTETGRYQALVSDVDHQVGKLMAKIDALGIADRTLVILTSDNGGSHFNDSIGTNAPLRGYKTDVFEGGVRVPMMARWKGVIESGSRYEGVFAGFDFFPTFAALLGSESGSAIADSLELDGQDMSNVLRTGSVVVREAPLFWERAGKKGHFDLRFGALDGPWKLVHSTSNGCPGLCLFNLDADMEEAHDLAGEEPEIATRLQRAYRSWRLRTGLLEHPIVSAQAVDGKVWTFDGGSEGAVVLGQKSLDRFMNADFSIRVAVTPSDLGAANANGQVIAERPGSWQLGIDAGRHVYFRAHGPSKDDEKQSSQTTLTSRTLLEDGEEVDVAVSIFGTKRNLSNMRLHLNGKLEAESKELSMVHGDLCEGEPVGRGCSRDTDCGTRGICSRTLDARIRLGGSADGSRPFIGSLRDPRFYVISLLPEDLRFEEAFTVDDESPSGWAMIAAFLLVAAVAGLIGRRIVSRRS